MIYLDNAATTGKKPGSVIRAVNLALNEYCANPGRSGHRLSEKTALAVYSAREKAAQMFGAPGAECVVFTAGCTHSINMVLKGVLRPEDHVIVSSLEHNAVIRPLHRMGVSYDTAQVSLTDDDQTVENFRRLIRPQTKMIFVTGASNVLGKALPVGRLGQLCREHGLLFGVDAAQSAGIEPIDMARDQINYLCIAPHKGLYAPMGVGILIAARPIAFTLIEGGTGTDSISPLQPEALPERLESGTVNVPGILGTAAGIDFVARTGVQNIRRHELRLIQKAHRRLERIEGVRLYTPIPGDTGWAPVLSFNIDGLSSFDTARILETGGVAVRAGLHCAPSAHRQIGTLETGTVRVCPSVFTRDSDIDTLVFLVRGAVKKSKFS